MHPGRIITHGERACFCLKLSININTELGILSQEAVFSPGCSPSICKLPCSDSASHFKVQTIECPGFFFQIAPLPGRYLILPSGQLTQLLIYYLICKDVVTNALPAVFITIFPHHRMHIKLDSIACYTSKLYGIYR